MRLHCSYDQESDLKNTWVISLLYILYMQYYDVKISAKKSLLKFLTCP